MSVVTIDPKTAVFTNRLKLGTQVTFAQVNAIATDSRYKTWAQGFKCRMIRFVDTQAGVNHLHACTNWNNTTMTGTFSWSTVDATVKAIINMGCEPLIVLGNYWKNLASATPAQAQSMIPPGMSIDSTTLMPTPANWAAYCGAWVQHFKDVGLAVKYYEIVNEPFVQSTNNTDRNNFMLIVNATAKKMRSINPNVSLSSDLICFSQMIDWWLAHAGVDLDRLDFHKYDCGTINPGSSYYYDDPTMFLHAEQWCLTTQNYLGRTLLQQQANWNNSRGKILPLMNSESNFNSSWGDPNRGDPPQYQGTDRRQELITGAVWLALCLRQEALVGVDYHIYFTIAGNYKYETTSTAKPGDGLGFGFIDDTQNGYPYIPYYVYQYIGLNLAEGDPIVSSATADARLRSLAWIDGSTLHIMLINKTHDQVSVSLQGVSGVFNFQTLDEATPSPIPAANEFTDRSPRKGAYNSAQPLTLNGYTVTFLSQPIGSPVIPQSSLPILVLLALAALALA